jgi:hypothetical protein
LTRTKAEVKLLCGKAPLNGEPAVCAIALVADVSGIARKNPNADSPRW